ncbi:MAG: type II secretion system F family protein, partial [Candidatus Omnitrophota bacterium]
MPKFVYEAKLSPGDVKRGFIEAENVSQAALKLGQVGLFVISIEEETADSIKRARFLSFSPSPSRALSYFTRQLSNLLDSGLTILKALSVLEEQAENLNLRRIISGIRVDIKNGSTFSSALMKYPKVFSDLYINMVSSGEASGSLEAVLERLSGFLEKDEENIAKVKSAMAYPALMAVVGCVTIFVLLTFVAPRLTGIFNDLGQALPLPTKMLIWVSSFFAVSWPVIILCLIFGSLAFNRWSKTPEGKAVLDGLKVKIPVIRVFLQKVEISRFSRTLATLIGNGVPVIRAFSIAAGTIDNIPM